MVVPVPWRPEHHVRTAVVAAALVGLTLDTWATGPLSRLESRAVAQPGPAPRWAKWATRLAEKEAVTGLSVLVVAQRCRLGADPVPPVAVLGTGMVARACFARAVRRPRPPEPWWRTEPHGWSFPSRHTTHASLAMAMLLDETAMGPRGRASVLVGFVGVVGASRVRLGVHWPSDVAGGVLTALLWRRVCAQR